MLFGSAFLARLLPPGQTALPAEFDRERDPAAHFGSVSRRGST